MRDSDLRELQGLIEKTRSVSFELPTKFDWGSGKIDEESADVCLKEIIFPAFELANELEIVGASFSEASFEGEGKVVLENARREGTSNLVLSYRPKLRESLREFFIRPSQGRGVLEELRGTIFFRFSVKQAEEVCARLGAPHVVKNVGVHLGPAAKKVLSSFYQSHSDDLLGALSDRSDFTAIHFFGSPRALAKLI